MKPHSNNKNRSFSVQPEVNLSENGSNRPYFMANAMQMKIKWKHSLFVSIAFCLLSSWFWNSLGDREREYITLWSRKPHKLISINAFHLSVTTLVWFEFCFVFCTKILINRWNHELFDVEPLFCDFYEWNLQNF